MEEEGTLIRVDDLIPAGNPLYRLYFKGLVTAKTTVFGVAIYGDKDDLLLNMKGPTHESANTLLEAELIALKRGLSEAVSWGIKHISICCYKDQIFELVSFPWFTRLCFNLIIDVLSLIFFRSEQENIALLMRDMQGIRKHLTSSIPVLLTPNQPNFAYELAIEAISSHEIIINIPAPKKTCIICLNNDLNADQMFSVGKCGHMFCSECVKRHIEVRLLEGSLMTCPGHPCKSMLTYGHCVNLLTPKLKEMWEQRIKEDLIPVQSRVYCPNPRCSALMSEIELSKLIGVKKWCVKCGESFCICCKVPWHNNLSCDQYKRLHPNHTINDKRLKHLANKKLWSQCKKCQHMIERSEGCVSVICRCGHEFCYKCGADAGGCRHGHAFPLTGNLLLTPRCFYGCLVMFLVIIAIVVVTIIFLIRRLRR